MNKTADRTVALDKGRVDVYSFLKEFSKGRRGARA